MSGRLGSFCRRKDERILKGFRHKKKYGQNFIHDEGLLRRIAMVADGSGGVLEIGAGAGSLTEALARRFEQVVALEIDSDLEPILRTRLALLDNVALVLGDAQRADFDILMKEAGYDRYAVVANLPYYITTPLIFKLLEEAPAAEELVLMMQREVAERLIAPPGGKTYGALSVAVQYHAAAEIAFDVGRGAFTPAPAVDSAVVHLRRYAEKPVTARDEAAFRRTVRAAFGQRRKTLRNALKNGGWSAEAVDRALEGAGISPAARGETLSVAQFVALSEGLAEGAL